MVKMMNDQNNQGISDFEGYSSDEMQYILYNTFEERSSVQLNELTESGYKKIPILNQIKFIADMINNEGELKLTKRGYLPPKAVFEIYNQGFLKDEDIESGISKLSKESDSNVITLTRILLDLCGIVKKRNNKLSITRNGEKILSDNHKLLKHIFSVFGLKFNWAYFDGFGDNNIGQLGVGFTLILLGKYGGSQQTDTFYADKYFKAFPRLIDESIDPIFGTLENYISRMYSVRTFNRFLDYFGLITIEQRNWDSEKYILKTELFDKFIKCKPHNKVLKG
jgi:hypothetical protein